MTRACTLLICLCPTTGWSEDNALAKRLYHAAERAFAKKDFRRAMENYERAYRARPLAGFLFNIGQCHRGLGQYRRAIKYFRKYLRHAPEGKHRDHAEQLIELCHKHLSEQPRAFAKRRTARPPEATGRAGAAGSAQAKDDEPPPGLRSETTRPVEQPRPPPLVRTDSSVSRHGRRRLHPVYFWSALGAAAALMVTTGTTGGLALSKSSRYKDPQTPQNELRALRDSGRGLKTAATATAALGAVAAVSAATLFFFTDFRPKRERLRAAVLPNAAMIGWSESF